MTTHHRGHGDFAVHLVSSDSQLGGRLRRKVGTTDDTLILHEMTHDAAEAAEAPGVADAANAAKHGKPACNNRGNRSLR